MLNEKSFLTKNYIDELIRTEKWSEHGSDLYRVIEDEIRPRLPISIQKTEPEELLAEPEFRNTLEKWLSLRFNYCKKNIIKELTEQKDKDGLYTLTRTIHCTKDLIEKIKTQDIDIGRFWTTTKYYEFTDCNNIEKEFEITVLGKVSLSDIDFTETMRSRMDYENGDQEAEIYIKEHAIPVFLSYSLTHAKDGYIGDFSCDQTEERKLKLNQKSKQLNSETEYVNYSI